MCEAGEHSGARGGAPSAGSNEVLRSDPVGEVQQRRGDRPGRETDLDGCSRPSRCHDPKPHSERTLGTTAVVENHTDKPKIWTSAMRARCPFVLDVIIRLSSEKRLGLKIG